MSYKWLQQVNSPADLRKFSLAELQELAKEIRTIIIDTVEQTGGHLGANLGVVELTLALHSVLNSPEDRIVWDVGHQSYTHKLVTGRFEQFSTLRQWEGLSGFPRRDENIHDHFGVGHSSTSISAAAGMAIARDLKNEKYNVVAVIGDGALTGGMAFEALNHIGSLNKDIIVILNDNKMSIDNNVGAMSDYLSRLRLDPTLFRARGELESLIKRIPAIGSPMSKLTTGMKEALKNMLPGQLFEELGFTYSGPFDGHNIGQLKKAIKDGMHRHGPVLLHVHTQKGKGHDPAEKNPAKFHGVSPIGNGKPKSTISYSAVFGDALAEIARHNPKIVAITAAMQDGTGLGKFAQEYPDRFLDVGIAEQHAVTLAAGLAASGMRSVFAVYSTFLQRGYDQIIHDICLQGLPVVFAIDRAGIVGDDGATHHGVFDVSYLRHIPNLNILAPRDGEHLRAMLAWALEQESPVAIRYPRGNVTLDNNSLSFPSQEPILAEQLREGRDCLLLAMGNMVSAASEAAALMQPEINCSVIDVRSIKPLDEATILRLARVTRHVVTIEDNVLAGGFGSSILELLSNEPGIVVTRLGYPDEFLPQGPIERIHEEYGLTSQGIATAVQQSVLGKVQLVATKGE